MNNFIIELRNIKKYYQDKKVLDGISIKIQKNEFISIMGPSGCGKSTLLNILGLLDSFEGEYLIDDQHIKFSQYAEIRNQYIGFVFQLYHLLPNITVKDNILLPIMYTGKGKIRESVKSFDEIVEGLGITEILGKKIDVLSGGEKQRAAIARAMILNPYILIADEPTGALDDKNARDVIGIFKRFVKKDHSVVMVTHNKEIANSANRRYKLCEGKLNEL